MAVLNRTLTAIDGVPSPIRSISQIDESDIVETSEVNQILFFYNIFRSNSFFHYKNNNNDFFIIIQMNNDNNEEEIKLPTPKKRLEYDDSSDSDEGDILKV